MLKGACRSLDCDSRSLRKNHAQQKAKGARVSARDDRESADVARIIVRGAATPSTRTRRDVLRSSGQADRTNRTRAWQQLRLRRVSHVQRLGLFCERCPWFPRWASFTSPPPGEQALRR